jgi:hypothetical protein
MLSVYLVHFQPTTSLLIMHVQILNFIVQRFRTHSLLSKSFSSRIVLEHRRRAFLQEAEVLHNTSIPYHPVSSLMQHNSLSVSRQVCQLRLLTRLSINTSTI